MKKAQYLEERLREEEHREECRKLLEYLRLYGYLGEDFAEGFYEVERKWERYKKLCESGLDRAEEEMLALARFKKTYAPFGEPLYENLRREILRKETLEGECRRLSEELSSPTLSQRESKEKRRKEIDMRLGELSKTIYATNQELITREEDYDTIEEKKAERDELRAKNERAEYRLHILEMTSGMLERAKESMQTSYLVPMKKNFESLLTTLSDKEAGEVFIDASFKVSSRQGGTTKSMEAMSRGERDLYLLISRLAIVDTLYPEGMLPPILLDDPFVAFDDGRTRRALSYLEALGKKRQIIYLTCSDARTI